jgi:type IV pilus assembly protein PilW
MKQPHQHRATLAAPATGRTLLELLVALVIGIIVLGSILLTSTNSIFSGRGSDTQSKLDETASLALSILVPQLRMAGYSAFQTAALQNYAPLNSPAVRGCDNGFATPTPAGWSGDPATQHSTRLSCNAGNGGNTAISVVYQADANNSIPDAAGNPRDCLGDGVAADPIIGVPVVENRYFLGAAANGFGLALRCTGNGANSNEELLTNIEAMRITYGVAALRPDDGSGVRTYENTVQQYLTQQAIDTPTNAVLGLDNQAVNDRWRGVLSVRLCITVRSDTQEAPQATPFPNCAGGFTTPNDRFLRKTVYATVALRNRIGL